MIFSRENQLCLYFHVEAASSLQNDFTDQKIHAVSLALSITSFCYRCQVRCHYQLLAGQLGCTFSATTARVEFTDVYAKLALRTRTFLDQWAGAGAPVSQLHDRQTTLCSKNRHRVYCVCYVWIFFGLGLNCKSHVNKFSLPNNAYGMSYCIFSHE